MNKEKKSGNFKKYTVIDQHKSTVQAPELNGTY
jgi:hypothetical protein